MSDKQPNPYKAKIINDFIKAYEKKKRLESSSNPDKNEEYNSTSHLLAKHGAELIKLGVNKNFKNGSVNIFLNNTKYELSPNDVRHAMGDEEFEMFFPHPVKKDEEKEKNIENNTAVEDKTEKRLPDVIKTPTPNENLVFNAWMQFMTAISGGNGNNANDSERSIIDDMNSLQRRVINMEKEKNDYAENLAQARKKYEDLKLSLKQSKVESDKKIASLKNEIDILEKTCGHRNSDVDDLSASIVGLEQQVVALASELKKADEIKNDAIKEKNDALKANKKLEETNNKLLNDIKEEKIKAEEAIKNASKNKEDNGRIKNLENQLEKERNKNNNLQKEIDKRKKLEDDMGDMISIRSENEKKIKEMENTIAELQQLAFYDEKTGVKNINAFNDDLSSADKKKTVLVMVGICGMKSINTTYGREKGDDVICYVADSLSDMFGDNNVYRILGDQFMAIITDDDVVSVTNSMNSFRSKAHAKGAPIAFGAVAGENCESVKLMVEQAEMAMNRAKSEPAPQIYQDTAQQQKRSQREKEQAKEPMPQGAMELNIAELIGQ